MKSAPPSPPSDDRIADAVLPHLDAAYNFARWLTRNEHDAEDVVQEACLRAFKYGGRFIGGDGRAWLLAIVRNTFYSMRKGNISRDASVTLDEELHSQGEDPGPEALMIRNADAKMITQAMEELSVEYREALVLREFEDLSYREIARVTGVPVGTVMSRLSRARNHIARAVKRRTGAAA